MEEDKVQDMGLRPREGRLGQNPARSSPESHKVLSI